MDEKLQSGRLQERSSAKVRTSIPVRQHRRMTNGRNLEENTEQMVEELAPNTLYMEYHSTLLYSP